MNKKNLIIRILRKKAHIKRTLEHKPFDSASVGDLAFLLLIYFIVTSSFILRQGIFFSLPSKSAGTIKVEENQIMEVFPRNDGFLYNGTLMSRDKFSEIMKKNSQGKKDKVLIINMDRDVKYNRLVDTLSVARETGVLKVSLKNTFQVK